MERYSDFEAFGISRASFHKIAPAPAMNLFCLSERSRWQKAERLKPMIDFISFKKFSRLHFSASTHQPDIVKRMGIVSLRQGLLHKFPAFYSLSGQNNSFPCRCAKREIGPDLKLSGNAIKKPLTALNRETVCLKRLFHKVLCFFGQQIVSGVLIMPSSILRLIISNLI